MRPTSAAPLVSKSISQHKQFHIDIGVEVKLDGGGQRRYEISGQIRSVKDETHSVRTWVLCKQFDTEKAAYEFGLQEACAWIDERG